MNIILFVYVLSVDVSIEPFVSHSKVIAANASKLPRAQDGGEHRKARTDARFSGAWSFPIIKLLWNWVRTSMWSVGCVMNTTTV
jgi:hypothetical protein